MHTLEDGRQLQAGLATVGANLKRINFDTGFGAVPVVLSQAVTTNDPKAVVTRQQNPTKNSFSVYLQGQESHPGHGNETVAWVAVEAGSDQTGGLAYEAGVTADVVTHGWYEVPFAQSYQSAPVVLAAMQQSHGPDPSGLRMQALTASRMKVMVEEEQSRDQEMNHTTEPVGYLTFEAGTLRAAASGAAVAASARSLSATESALATEDFAEQPDRFVLEQNYPNPFNPQTLIRYTLPQQAAVRLEVYNAIGQRVALLVDQEQTAGVYEAVFEGGSLPSGVYLYRLMAGSYRQTHSMILSK